MNYKRRKFLEDSGKMIAGSLLLSSQSLTTPVLLGKGIQNPPKSSRRKKILLRSGWQTINIGDIGHTPGTLHVLEQFVPEADVTLWAVNINKAIEEMLLKRFPGLIIIQGSLTAENDESWGNPVILDAIKNTDLFIYNSGMHFNFGLYNYDWNGFIKNVASCLYACQCYNKPYGLYGHSFDKFASPSHFIFKPILERAAFIFCRDSVSLQFLKQHNISPPVLEFGPDGCFGIDVTDDKKGLDYLAAEKLYEGQFMALVIRSYSSKLVPSKNSDDVLNPAKPTPDQTELDKQRYQKINALVTAWVRTTRKKVLLAPEVDKEIVAVKALVYDQQPEDVKPYLVHRDRFWNADEACSVYKRAELVVGLEPHSLIMALAFGVPVVHICPFTFGNKGWMFSDIGLREWLFDIDKDDARNMVNEVMAISQHPQVARKKVQKAMQYVKASQIKGAALIKKILGQK